MLLFDQNLSHRLPHRLRDLFPGSEHVRAAGLDTVDDGKIWAYAIAKNLAIVTQDSDYVDRSRVFAAPPKVVWLRCGNSTPAQIERLIRREVLLIAELLRNPSLHYVELY
jgi:predicted nuclease of predicted toxin-antitoxin system